MKVSVKSVLKASEEGFECFEQQRIVFRAGNMLCVREIERGDGFFIPLQKHIDELYCFRVASNRKSIFAAEKHADDVQLSQYWLSGEHKALSLTAESLFFSEVDSLELLIDEYDSNLVYGAAKNKDTACVFLADMGKLKVMAIGFLPTFSDFKIDGRENMTVSVCGCGPHNYIKCLRYGMNQWEVHEQAYKRVQEAAIQHQILYGGRQLIITASQIFLFEEHQFLQEITFSDAKSSIIEVVKVPKGLLVRFGDDSLRLLVEDSDETSFVHVGVVRIELIAGQKIVKMGVSHSMEQVVLKTSIHNYYVWRCEHISSTTQRSELIFNRAFHSCSHQPEGTISISTGKKYCLLAGTANATLWSIQNNQTVLSCDFAEEGKRVLLAGAINPDGNSMLLAFEDKVRLYRILLTKFKQVCQFSIKRCQSILFSHGGQLAACKFGKGANSCVTIVNMLRLVELCTLKLQSEPKQLIWNQLDQQLVVSTEANTVQVYRIAEATRIHSLKLPEEVTQIRIDYKTKQIVASSLKQVFLLAEGRIIEQFSPPVPHFHYLYPLYGVYFAATTTGELLWSYSMRFETYHQIPLFSNKTFSLLCRNGLLLAYASFRDIIVLRCDRATPPGKKPSGEEIVMVERDEVVGMFEKVRLIESSYEILTTASQAKLQQEKQKYQAAIEGHRQAFQDQVAFLKSKLAELASEKLRQQKESEKIFGDLQEGQVRNVAELQRMYDRKFQIQKQKYLNLQQSFLEQRIKYERLILEMEAKCHSQVAQVREQYARAVREQSLRAQSYKHSNWQEKAGMEMKLIDLQQENELALRDVQLSADSALQQLQLRHAKLEEEHQQAQIRIHSQQAELQAMQAEARSRRAESETLQKRVAVLESRIALLQRETGRKDQTIASKNQVMEEQAHQIAALQKAKYVLSFRTTQIRKELEPKEEQVDKLKAEMFKLQEEYREQKKRGAQLLARIEKLQRISEISKREVGDLRIALKHKQRTHDDLCSEIFSLVNGTDQKDWSAHIVRLYQSYIREQQHAGRGRRADDTTEQLSRHLRHVEQSLMQVTSGTDKVLRGKEKQVMRKMKENSQLVYELNVMRKKENDFSRERRDLHNENARLKRELHESMRTTTIRSQTATGLTRRVISRESREKSLMLDIHELEKSKAEIKSSRVDRNRLVSTRRTLLAQDEKKQKQSKIFDIARQLQSARTTIKRQDRMIEELNQRLGTTLDQ